MKSPALPISVTTPKVSIHDGKAVTTTDDVAAYFGKQSHHVVQKIESLECSKEFIIRNFSRMIKIVQLAKGAVREVVYYEMTKDGFVFLVMGFTGKKAAAFKEAYIAEFNRMESELIGNVKQIAPTVSQEEIDAYNINALAKHFRVCLEAWKCQIEPALRKIESPLAGRLYDRFKDGSAFLKMLEKSLNSKLTSGQRPRIY